MSNNTVDGQRVVLFTYNNNVIVINKHHNTRHKMATADSVYRPNSRQLMQDQERQEVAIIVACFVSEVFGLNSVCRRYKIHAFMNDKCQSI